MRKSLISCFFTLIFTHENTVSECVRFSIALMPECYIFAPVNKTLGQAIVL